MQVAGGGGGGAEVEFLTEKKIPLRNVPGVLKRKTKNKQKFGGGAKKKMGSRGVGKRYTSSYDHDM